MPRGYTKVIIPASSEAVFAVLHDYNRRLQWDTLLSDARLCDGWQHAQLHATTMCTGRWYLGGISLKTEYISFKPPAIAAVKMIDRPSLFDRFAATIRHVDLENGESSLEYIYDFRTRPSWLRWLLDPLMDVVFRWETKKRLRSLREFCRRSNGECP